MDGGTDAASCILRTDRVGRDVFTRQFKLDSYGHRRTSGTHCRLRRRRAAAGGAAAAAPGRPAGSHSELSASELSGESDGRAGVTDPARDRAQIHYRQ